MSLSLATLPNPADEIRRLRQENETLREQVREAQDEANGLRREVATMTRGIQELRAVLTPIYQGLQHIFGQIDEVGVGSAPSASPQKSAVWESWKQKLGGKASEAIDILMLHGEMSADQLRIHLKCATNYVYVVISQLNKAQIINKRDGKVSLKEL